MHSLRQGDRLCSPQMGEPTLEDWEGKGHRDDLEGDWVRKTEVLKLSIRP